MKLLIIACHPVSYQLPLFCSIQSKLRTLNINTSVAFLDNFSLNKTYFSDIDGNLDIEPHEYLSNLTHTFSRNLSNGKQGGYFSRVNLDILPSLLTADFILLHGYEYFAYFFILVFSIIFRKKIIFRGEATVRVECADEHVSMQPSPIAAYFKSIYVSLFLRYSHIVLYSCSRNKTFFEKYIGNHSGKLRAFPCCVDNNLCKTLISRSKRQSLRSYYKVRDNDLVIGYTGRLTSRKNLGLLLDAISLMSDELRSLVLLVFVGGGPEAAALAAKAQSLNIRLVITSFLSHKRSLSYLNMFDVFCIPSLYDPSPKSLNEAMNFALPVLVSDRCGTAPDLVYDNINGFTFSPCDASDLSGKLTRLCSLPSNSLCNLGKASAELVSRFSPDYAASQLGYYLRGYEY